jgi:hypothetical protein
MPPPAGEGVYIHCWGGVGRTGTVVACLLAKEGLGYEETMIRLRQAQAGSRKSHRPSPEAETQRRRPRGGFWSADLVAAYDADPHGRRYVAVGLTEPFVEAEPARATAWNHTTPTVRPSGRGADRSPTSETPGHRGHRRVPQADLAV